MHVRKCPAAILTDFFHISLLRASACPCIIPPMLINISHNQRIKLFIALFTAWMALSGILQLARPISFVPIPDKIAVSDCPHSKSTQQIAKGCYETCSHLSGIVMNTYQLNFHIPLLMVFLCIANLYRMLRLHVIYKPPRSLHFIA